MRMIKQLLLVCVCAGLAACQGDTSSSGGSYGSYNKGGHATGHLSEGLVNKKVHIGKPYTIKGKRYTPKYQPYYNETGVASWYGPGFHGKKTANGETYDQYAMTAAHPTLPIPSLVRVTNLDNNQAVVVRINDRGPFARGRIIDLSRRAAESIGIHGIEQVRVQYLKEETERFWAENQINTNKIPGVQNYSQTAVASNAPVDAPRFDSVRESNASSAPIMSVSSTQVADLQSPSRPPKQPLTNSWEGDEPVMQVAELSPTRRTEEVQLQPSNWNRPALVDRKPQSNLQDRPPISSDQRGYFIQAGAFASKSNADQLTSRLSHIGRAFIDHLQRAGGTLYRVRMGPYDSYGEASNLLHEVFKLGIRDAAVVAIK